MLQHNAQIPSAIYPSQLNATMVFANATLNSSSTAPPMQAPWLRATHNTSSFLARKNTSLWKPNSTLKMCTTSL